jgi:hypothetical protein
MTVHQLIQQNPEVTAGFVAFLFYVIAKLFMAPYKQLSAAMNTLTLAVGDIKGEIEKWRKEAKTDREKDTKAIGLLKDRMQAQETHCATTQQFCPYINHKEVCPKQE